MNDNKGTYTGVTACDEELLADSEKFFLSEERIRAIKDGERGYDDDGNRFDIHDGSAFMDWGIVYFRKEQRIYWWAPDNRPWTAEEFIADLLLSD